MQRRGHEKVSGSNRRQQGRSKSALLLAVTPAVETLECRTFLSATVITSDFNNFLSNANAQAQTGVPPVPAINSVNGGTNNDLMLTNGGTATGGSQATSSWYGTQVPTQNFTSSFTYTESNPGGGGPADGFVFVLQNATNPTFALGGNGGGMGYTGITPSFAIDFNIYNGSHTGDNFNGGGPTNAVATGPVNLTSGDPINIVLNYNGTTNQVYESLHDTVTGATFYNIFNNVNIGNQIGTTTAATIGFCGGNGGGWAQQDLTNFVYSTNTTAPQPFGQLNGFSGFQLNAGSTNPTGVPSISSDSNTLTLTTAAANEASSAFSNPADVYTNFTSTFTYQESGGTSTPGDGFTFTLQNDSRGDAAVGGSGTDLGYSNAANPSATAVSPSVAIEFNMSGVSAISATANGATTVSTSTSNTGSVNLGSGDPINVSINYNSNEVTATLTDTKTNATYTTTFNQTNPAINIAGILGGNTAFVGFTGSTGSDDAVQTISNFTFTPVTSARPAAVGSVSTFTNQMTFNGTSGIAGVSADNSTLTITTAANGEDTSAFYNTPVTYQNFDANFNYTDVSTGGADGFAFVLQNSGLNALGGGGGSIGYSGITPSFGVEFNVYNNSVTQASQNGNVNKNDNYENTGAVNLRSGDTININLSYNSAESTLTETLTDATAGTSFTQLYTEVNLPNILGSNTALLGFTGGTGGANALQTITGFTYTTSANNPINVTPTLPAGATSASGFAGDLLNVVSLDNGVPAVSADTNTLTITNGNNTEQVLALSPTPVVYGDFNASFTYTEAKDTDTAASAAPADGIAFTLEAQPLLGQQGGQIGYGGSVPNSFAVEFNVYQVSSTGIGAGGAVSMPYNAGGNVGSVVLTDGDPIAVSLTYNSSAQTLTETLTDPGPNNPNGPETYTTTYNNVNLTQILGNSPSAYVGFSGATGGSNALQTISGFSYTADTTLPAVQTGPQVNLTGYYTSYGISNPGTAAISTGSPNGVTFPVPGGGTTGYDGGGNQLDNTYVGPSVTVTANGNTQTFNFGPVATPNSPDVITAEGQFINLPQGHYGNISILGSAANGAQQNQPFTVNYTDGTSQTFSQSLSDWWAPATTFPGETVALSMPDHLDNNGNQGTQGAGQNININEYQFAVNPAKTVSSITLPDNMNVKVLAINVNAAPAVTSITPTSGPAAGGTTVTINGTGFTGATAVDFGTTPATSFTVNSAGTQITAVDPAGTGKVDVTVTGPFGTSPTTAADQFTYTSGSITITSVVVNGDNPNGLYTDPGAANGKQRSMVEDIVYTFSAPVTITNANQAFTMALAGSTGTLPSTLSAVSVPGSNGTQWAVILTGKAEGTLASIANGEYSITINPQYVVSAADGTTPISSGRTDKFYRLFGDINGDQVVNAADNFQLKTALTTYNSAFDSNGDGVVNAADNFQFKASQSISFVGFTPTI